MTVGFGSVLLLENRTGRTWMEEQAGKFVEHVKASGQEITLLLRDRDVIYGQGFDKTIRESGIKVNKNRVRARPKSSG